MNDRAIADDLFSGVILAGGRSLRMGTDKSAVRLAGRSMLQHVISRLRPQTSSVSINADAGKADLAGDLVIVPDTVRGRLGPLAGVLSAMRHGRLISPQASHVVTVPTDTPFFPKTLVSRLAQAVRSPGQIAIAFSGSDMHPVFGLWPVDIADDLESWLLADDKRRVRSFIARHSMVPVDFPAVETTAGRFDPFFNINTPEDVKTAERWLPLIEGAKV